MVEALVVDHRKKSNYLICDQRHEVLVLIMLLHMRKGLLDSFKLKGSCRMCAVV